jgi:Zn finger protein HypA/HybF involved in hydrogenase expression
LASKIFGLLIIDYSAFKPLAKEDKKNLRNFHNISDDDFVIGFVFKNQLRKSVPNLLQGFKLFKEQCPPHLKPKLLLHTEWEKNANTWDIESYIKELNIDINDVKTTYICTKCNKYTVIPYQGNNLNCPFCKSEKSFSTKQSNSGVSEHQLNEIYNMMDVYCHPFTSGGQELPIQEAKASGLITLVTEYSCGTDSCYPIQGGLPLSWNEYREPFTNFIKATTDPKSIAENLLLVTNLSESEKETLINNGIKHVNENFSIDKICNRIKEISLEFPKCTWDFDFKEKLANVDYAPNDSLQEDEDWLIDVFYGIFGKKFKRNEFDIIENVKLIKRDGREKVLQYLKQQSSIP